MILTKFVIKNFKGIQRTELKLVEGGSLVERSGYAPRAARVHALVGLNESGKTTLLNAMHSFNPDAEAQKIQESSVVNGGQSEKLGWIPETNTALLRAP